MALAGKLGNQVMYKKVMVAKRRGSQEEPLLCLLVSLNVVQSFSFIFACFYEQLTESGLRIFTISWLLMWPSHPKQASSKLVIRSAAGAAAPETRI